MAAYLDKLSPARMRRSLEAKGWSIASAAWYFECDRKHLHRILNDQERKRHWEAAIAGIPLCDAELRRAYRSYQAIARASSPVRITSGQPGYRLKGEFILGLILTATRYVGSIAEEGEQGRVVDIRDTGVAEEYLIRFKRGEDWFGPNDIDPCMASTGMIAEP